MPVEPLLTTLQAARYLSISARSLRRMLDEPGGPPHIRLSKRIIRFQREHLEAWLVAAAKERLNFPVQGPTENAPT